MKTNWGRFSLVDGMILIAAAAIGMAVATHSGRPGSPRIIWALSAVLDGAVYAGPLILASQCIRGRRAALSPGECLWLSPFVIGLAGLPIILILPVLSSALALLLGSAQVILSVVAFYRLIAGFVNKRPVVECRWTDCLGSSVCAAYMLVIAIVIYIGFNRL